MFARFGNWQYPQAEQDPFGWRARGWYRMMLDEFDQAESDLQKARSYFPFSWKTHNELAAANKDRR